MTKPEFGVNFEAYFLGPKGENYDFYEKLLKETLKDHIHWRKAFHADTSEDFITDADKRRADFRKSQEKIEDTLHRLTELLKKNQPFFSPRYIGHMNWETMAAPLIAYFSAALYNPNNVAKAGSTGTSDLEIEVGKDFLKLFGFDEIKGWGHICTGGTIANMEALWMARNMKVIPVVLKEMLKTFKIKDKLSTIPTKKLLKCFNPGEILDLKDLVLAKIKKAVQDDKKVENTFEHIDMQERGLIWEGKGIDIGVVFLPETKHYSLKKAMDLLGLGRQNACFVPVDKNYRMDMKKLREMIFEVSRKRPILAVVGVVGSTEESSVDEIDQIIEIRKELQEKKDMGFHIHIDAAYGGYVRSLFLDQNGNFMNKEQLAEQLKLFGIIGDKKERREVSWPHKEVFKAFAAMPEADTITVDPHKLGYILYPAGGIAMKDKRMRESIQTFAPYVFPRPQEGEPDALIGAYILEGSKPGAAAAAVWTAHRIMPLDITGYGKLIGETIDGAQALWYGLTHSSPFTFENNIKIRVYPVIKPDINIVNYAFNFEGNRGLEKMNRLTSFISDEILGYLPRNGKLILDRKFIVSTTDFTIEEYENSPLPFLQRIGFSKEEWNKIRTVKIIRSVIMSPYLTPDYVDVNYVQMFIDYLREEITRNSEQILKILS
ncbi:MAG: pyridoxal-dependent decarboxylase [Candidatus Aminicenantes bacterium]|nr:pyridoxal-dependent decarboxylase [Candidatus Aminicenantes bacterium]